MLAATLLACVAIVRAARTRPDARWLRPSARALAAVLVVNEAAIRAVEWAAGDLAWSSSLPLQLSDAALVAAAIALWVSPPPQLAFELTYYWSLTATVQAMITPDLNHGPGHYFFWAFFVAHAGPLIATAYLAWGRGLVPRRGSAWRALGATALVTTAAAAGSYATGGNYMFLRRPPDGSLLEAFGPWPWYLVVAALLALVAFLALERLRRADPSAAWRRLGAQTNEGRPVVALAWALYDLANTVFSFAIVSFAMSLWTISALGAGPGTFWFTAALSTSVLLNAAVSPVLGAMSDRLGRRKPFLAVFTLMFAGATTLIGVVDIAVGLVLFALANFSFQAALIYYDALLPEVARPEARGRMSGLGAALGYAGALLAGLVFQLTTDQGRTTALSFAAVGALVAVFSLPLFAFVHERGKPAAARRASAGIVRRPWRETAAAFRRARAAPGLLRFILSRFLYSDTVNTAIAVMSAFAVAAVGLEQGEALNVLLVLIAVAVLASFGWGRAADRLGPRRALMIVLGLWCVGLALLAGFLAPAPFLLAGALLGAGLGGTAVVDRVLLARLAPAEELGEMFGIYGLVGKASAVIGPLAYGGIVAALIDPLGRGAYQVAVVVLLVPLVLGLLVLARVPETEPVPRRRTQGGGAEPAAAPGGALGA